MILRRQFLKRMAFAAVAAGFLDLTAPVRELARAIVPAGWASVWIKKGSADHGVMTMGPIRGVPFRWTPGGGLEVEGATAIEHGMNGWLRVTFPLTEGQLAEARTG